MNRYILALIFLGLTSATHINQKVQVNQCEQCWCKSEIADLQTQIEDENAEFEGINDRIAALQGSISTLQVNLGNVENQNNKLLVNLENVENTNRNLQSQIQNIEGQLTKALNPFANCQVVSCYDNDDWSTCNCPNGMTVMSCGFESTGSPWTAARAMPLSTNQCEVGGNGTPKNIIMICC